MTELSETTSPIKIVCSDCESTDVMRDAWAEWNETKQAWQLRGDPFDQAYCETCEGETHLEELPLTK